MKGFFEFIKQYGVIGLALAVIIGGKLNALVSAVVDGFIMPVVGALTPGGNWRTATYDVGSMHFQPGIVLAALLDFLIVAAVVYMIAKLILREEKVAKK